MLWWFVVPAVLVLLAWQVSFPTLLPAPGFDESWTAGLSMAVEHHLVFGQHVIFTYGPLGFLSTGALWSVPLAALSVAYTFIVRFLFALVIFTSARKSFGVLTALVASLVAASVGSLLIEPVILLIPVTWVIADGISDRRTLLLAAAAGAFSALELLNKVSIGLSLVAMTVVFVLFVGRWVSDTLRHAGVALLAFVVVLLVLWIGTGQPLEALPDYLVNAARETMGYASAFGDEGPGLGWQYPAALLALALGLYGGWQMTVGVPGRRRCGVMLLWAVFWFFAFKEGFVRHDVDHVPLFFDAVLGGFFAFRWRGWPRAAAVLALLVLVAFALEADSTSLTSELDPARDVKAAYHQVENVADQAKRNFLIAFGRAEIKATDPVPPGALRMLRGHTVAVWPSEIALAWAYQLDWDPLPVMQTASAYTGALDRTDADFVASSQAPERILLDETPDPNGRIVSFDEGITSRAILCHYRPVFTGAKVAVLGRTANRCSTPTLIATRIANRGQSVPVPAPPNSHSLVSVRIKGVQTTGLGDLAGFFYKPPEQFISLNQGPPRRLVSGTADDGLPLRASPGLDYQPPFNIAYGAHAIAVGKQGAELGLPSQIQLSFYSQSLSN